MHFMYQTSIFLSGLVVCRSIVVNKARCLDCKVYITPAHTAISGISVMKET